jgi:hypothetical protein
VANNIQVLGNAFYQAVRAVVSRAGTGAIGPTFDTTGVVGAAVVVPGAGNGLIIEGVAGSADSDAQLGISGSVRLVVCSLQGQANALAALVQSFPALVGAFQSTTIAGVGTSGIVVPDLSTMQGNGAIAGLANPGAANGLRVHLDVSDTVLAGASNLPGARSVKFGTRGLVIPPNTSVAAVFISLRPWDTGAPIAPFTNAMTVGGSLFGYPLSAADLKALGSPDFGRTPGRFGNVATPGTLR